MLCSLSMVLLSTSLYTFTLADPLIPLRVTAGVYSPFFDANVTIGDQTFLLLADTGSSDLWIVQDGFQCIDPTTGNTTQQSACTFANTTFKASSSFKQSVNQSLGAQYGAGDAFGIIGTDTVTLGGLQVQDQIIGVVNEAAIVGDGVNSGILGLGYPALTSSHPGDTPPAPDALLLDKLVYDPLFVSMYKRNLTQPWYSFALERLPQGQISAPGGYLGLGVLPPSSHSPNFTTVPTEITDSIPVALTNGTRTITEWTLSIDAVTWQSRDTKSPMTNTTRFQAVVDTGNYYNLLPAALADSIHAAYSPPATLNSTTGMYNVACNATPPSFGLTIGGTTFYHKPEDMTLQLLDGSCISTILPSATNAAQQGVSLNFLGDVFLHNVVAVFDMGKGEMRFAERLDGVGGGVNSTTVANGTTGGSSGSSGTAPKSAANMHGETLWFVTGVVVLLMALINV